MRILYTTILILGLVLSSCSKEVPTINGTWNLSKVGGVKASVLDSTSTLTITNGTSYAETLNLQGQKANLTGTVTKKTASVYTLTGSDDGTSSDYTLSEDGKTLSTDEAGGSYSYTK